MGSFLANNIINIILGITMLVMSAATLHYKRLEHRKEVESVIDIGRKTGLFLSREAMIHDLLEMYERAGEGDVIWAQSVCCTDFTPEIRTKILHIKRGIAQMTAVADARFG